MTLVIPSAQGAANRVDTVVVYKVDRLTRSLADFAKIVEVFDAKNASFVSVTQAFNTTTSMGRLTLNVFLSFAQFERGGQSPSRGHKLTTFEAMRSSALSPSDDMGCV